MKYGIKFNICLNFLIFKKLGDLEDNFRINFENTSISIDEISIHE
jgi:hypothetical protein